MRIVWRGNFDLTGFGKASISSVSALKKIGVDIKVINTSGQSLRLVKLPLNVKQLEIKAPKNDDILIQHVPPSDFQKTDAAVHIGYTTFESPKILDPWVEKMALLDAIFVPSKWNKDILIDHGVNENRISVIPYIVNMASIDPSRIDPLIIKNKKKFSFLSVIDFTYRKGWDLLLQAFWTEFRPDEDVSLILKTYHNSFAKDDRAKVSKYIQDLKNQLKLKEIPQTLIYDWPIHDNLLPSFYKSCNAYVFPSRGEGFSLTCAEAMALELPVIATHFGGHTDYMNYTNSTLVKYVGFSTMTKEQLDLSPQYETLPLAQPSLPHLRECMRKVYVHYDECLDKAKKGRQDIIDNFSEIKVGVNLLEAIERVAHQ